MTPPGSSRSIRTICFTPTLHLKGVNGKDALPVLQDQGIARRRQCRSGKTATGVSKSTAIRGAHGVACNRAIRRRRKRAPARKGPHARSAQARVNRSVAALVPRTVDTVPYCTQPCFLVRPRISQDLSPRYFFYCPELITCRHWQPRRRATRVNSCFQSPAMRTPGMPRSMGVFSHCVPSVRTGLS
jgi:hypothetical protein